MKDFHNIESKPKSRDGLKFYIGYGGGSVWRIGRNASHLAWRAYEQQLPYRAFSGDTLREISEKLEKMTEREVA